MSEHPNWSECSFDESCQLVEPNVHDNFVYGLSCQFDQDVVIINTQYRDEAVPHPLTDLRFGGVVAHHFYDVGAPSVLFDVGLVTPSLLVELWSELFESRKNYSWPISFVDLEDLVAQLDNLGVSGFRVMASCGMDGFVLASEFHYRHIKAIKTIA